MHNSISRSGYLDTGWTRTMKSGKLSCCLSLKVSAPVVSCSGAPQK